MMLQFSIQVLANNQKILEAEFLQIRPDGKRCILRFEEVFDFSDPALRKETEFEVHALIHGEPIYLFEFGQIDSDILFKLDGNDCTGTFYCTLGAEEMQTVLEILRGWCGQEEAFRDWRGKSEAFCLAWVLAAMKLPEAFKKTNDLVPPMVVDGAEIDCKDGFYCALGEAFFGKMGYLGANLDALDDCLGMLDVPAELRKVHFKNWGKIQKVLDSYEDFQVTGTSYSDRMHLIFERHGFHVQGN